MGRAVSECQAHRAHSFYGGLRILCVCVSVWGIPGTAFPSLSRGPSPWRASLIAQLVKNPPAVQETPVQFLGGKDPLEKELRLPTPVFLGFSCGSPGKESTCNSGDPGLISGLGRSPEEGKGYPLQYSWASLVAQLVKNPPARWETWVRSLGWEDPLEKGKATHSSILAWTIPCTV